MLGASLGSGENGGLDPLYHIKSAARARCNWPFGFSSEAIMNNAAFQLVARFCPRWPWPAE
jgi:hypothetical protein